ncbi:hypothetical protein GCM10025860_22200 [Methanobacterium ferruginis]|nr:hypothetical protein GCM10025860_22200 [Methanobacterium ferruginis]
MYKNLNPEEKEIFKKFLDPVYYLLFELDNRDLLNYNFNLESAKQFLLFIDSIDKQINLYNNLVDNQENLNSITGETDVRYLTPTLSIMIHEKLRIVFNYFINFNKLQLKGTPFLSKILTKLKKEFPANEFLLELNSEIRNAAAHYSYYIKGNHVCICKNFFDMNPKLIEFKDFEKELKKFNIIVDLFIATYFDDFKAEWIYQS